MRAALLTLLAAPLLAATARADEKIFSGPQPGEKLTPFKVQGFSGPDAGKEFQLPPTGKNGATLLVFVHEITRPALQLLRPLNHYADKFARDGLQAHVVWLSADRSKAEEFLTRAKASLSLTVPVSISLDGLEGPGNYGLNRKVALTILVAKDGKVTDNFAIVQPNETDAPKVVAAVAKATGQQAPTADEIQAAVGKGKRPPDPPPMGKVDPAQRAVMAELARLQKQVEILTDALNEARAKIARLEGKPAPAPLTTSKAAPEGPGGKGGKDGKPSANPELLGFMRRLIQKDNSEEAVKEIAAEMTRWAGDDAARRTELADYCRLVARLGYGTPAAQRALKKLAGE